MKKFLLITLVALLGIATANAQIKFGAKAGMNLTTITDDDEAEFKFGFHVGGFAEFVLNERISLQPELLYSTQGATSSYSSDGLNVDETVSLDYINVPVLLKVNIAGGLSAEVGPQIGFLLSAKAKEEAMGVSASVSIKDECKKFDVSAAIGLSYTFAEKFVASARYNLGLTNLPKDEEFKSKNSAIQISFGYKF
jgi:hypothetical protein